jgi:hypothetical protein
MPVNPNPGSFDLWGVVGALCVALVSGSISIARRVLSGYRASFLWILTEYMTAILCGYLAYYSYPALISILPTWATMPVVVAIAAHSGGRVLQEAEMYFFRYTRQILNPPKE